MQNITGYSNYIISPNGEVFNIKTGRRLKYDINSVGYRRVTLSEKGNIERLFVHRLVALHYLPNPTGASQVNHKDGNKLNNSISNLEWVTCSENRMHALKTGLVLQGELNSKTSLTNKEVEKVCQLIEQGKSRGVILKEVPSVSKHVFDDIRRRKTWKHISCNFVW